MSDSSNDPEIKSIPIDMFNYTLWKDKYLNIWNMILYLVCCATGLRILWKILKHNHNNFINELFRGFDVGILNIIVILLLSILTFGLYIIQILFMN